MSCLVAGWGFLYVGRLRWALCVAGLTYGGVILAGLMGWITTPKGAYSLLAFVVLVKLTSATASAVFGRKRYDCVARPGVRVHLLYVAALIAISLALFYPLRSTLLGYKLYYVPSNSMDPTLAIGDYFISDTRYTEPKTGDIVVYKYQDMEHTKRVAATAGDTLEIVNGDLTINGQNLGLFHAPADRVKKAYSLNLAPLKVEPNHVYLLSDNRDSSTDSRFMGQVAISDITGKATGILFSEDHSKIATNFD